MGWVLIAAALAAPAQAHGAAPLRDAANAPPRRAAAPPPLSQAADRVDVRSAKGAGVFGAWRVDGRGLPAYDYTLDHRTRPEARQPELAGKREAWHQLGNDHIVANAFNRGHVQLWSQDRVYQWVNLDEPADGRYAGGHGYLRVGGDVISTLWDDAPPGATRRFGTGFFERLTPARPVSVRERVYAPWGDDPVLLHDVVLRNHTSAPVQASWFEYWGVNPVQQLPANRVRRGLAPARYDSRADLLTAGMRDPQDARPLTIYLAAVKGPTAVSGRERGAVRGAPPQGFETTARGFFGDGTRQRPAAVAADRLSGTLSPGSPFGTPSSTVFALRAPVTVPPNGTVTLRYAYGAAHHEQIGAILARARAAADPFADTARAWRRWLPQVRLGSGREWLSREAQWDAYLLRSGVTYEEECGRHILSQGGFYQYSLGIQAAFRDPLQHVLPLVHMEPWVAQETLLYSAQEQPHALAGFIPYALLGLCTRFDFGSSNDLDLWLLLTAAEYGLATRDLAFFDAPVTWADGGTAPMWEHLKLAFRHQESQRGAFGGYVTGATGDWSDFATELLPMTESLLVTAQAAYIYARLAELAEAKGDAAFAEQLRGAARRAGDALRKHWVGRGWYARAYAGAQRLGEGVIYGEPQPWALLAGIPDRRQAITLVANIRRFLTGVGSTHGKALIGSSQSPARDDPDVTERTLVGGGVGDDNAVFVGGAWYAINGWLTWALGALDGSVPGARGFALDELERNTLTAHAEAFPQHWNGIVSVDDACRAHYDPEPSRCGVGLSTNHDGQIMHQPAWTLFDVIRLVGLEPTAGGWRIAPHLPLTRYRVALPRVGIAREPGRLRGYVRVEQPAQLELSVRPPAGTARHHVFVAGRRARFRRDGRLLRFTLPARPGTAADWAVTYRRR